MKSIEETRIAKDYDALVRLVHLAAMINASTGTIDNLQKIEKLGKQIDAGCVFATEDERSLMSVLPSMIKEHYDRRNK